VLVICCFSLLFCVAEIFLPPPFGINTGAIDGAECNATGFEPMTICICPRETVCVKDVKSLAFLALAQTVCVKDVKSLAFLALARYSSRRIRLGAGLSLSLSLTFTLTHRQP